MNELIGVYNDYTRNIIKKMNFKRSVFMDMFCFILFLFCTIHTTFGKECSSDATCMSIRKCYPYRTLLKKIKKPLPPQVVKFLRSQECGFINGFPKVCCSSSPNYLEYLKMFERPKVEAVMLNDQPLEIETTTNVPVKKTTKYVNFPGVLFDITVITAPPDATPVPYLKKFRNNNLEEYLNELAYDLMRLRRSSKGSDEIDIEIR